MLETSFVESVEQTNLTDKQGKWIQELNKQNKDRQLEHLNQKSARGGRGHFSLGNGQESQYLSKTSKGEGGQR